MGSLSTTCEISEAVDELDHVQHSGKTSGISVDHREGKLPVLRLGLKDSLEDDINQLFESFNLKNSSRISSPSRHVDGSPLRKNALKKPIVVGVPRSPRYGSSEPVTLKQALRDLCLSKASETAAMRRLSKSSAPSGNSEAGRIKNLYDAKIVERSAASSSCEDKDGVLEISLVPKEDGPTSPAETALQIDIPIASSSRGAQVSPQESSSCNSQANVQKDNSLPSSSSSEDKIRNSRAPEMKSSIQRAYSPRSLAVKLHRDLGINLTQDAAVATLEQVTIKTLKEELVQQQESVPESAFLSCLNENGRVAEAHINVSALSNLRNKASASKPARKSRLHNLHSSSSSAGGTRVGKSARTTSSIVKPARNKSTINKKAKKDVDSAAAHSEKYTESSASNPTTSQLICKRCQCSLENENAQSNQDPASFQHSERTIEKAQANNSMTAAVTAKNNSRSRDKGEFSQSSKSSLGEYSSSTTSISDESNLSRSSCSNRPHMSKDIRWEAIRHVRRQCGALGLSHFNLLKKLGSGDIGTVYLAELIGTNCLFAIKVMDNEFLARRKKMPRAQTEREILRTLDHPFLPTLFAQFTSDNLSCLVMEYCPGGDLHVLRQRQPERRFIEPAARFYVAEVLLALEYLHMLGIVYRDLKPENILVREDGHIMLTDFDLSLRCAVSPTLLKSPHILEPPKVSGTATCESTCAQPFCIEPSCRVPCFSPRFLPANAKAGKSSAEPPGGSKLLLQLVAEPTDARSNSFVGTHEYLAPEIIKGEGHGAAVDWWTFGIFLYELLYGKTPFKGSGNEETLANVVLQSLRFPKGQMVSFQAQDLIRGLLVKEPENRLGTGKGAAEIKQHPFFEGLNWALIRCAIPPELPECYDFGVRFVEPQGPGSKYLECKATGEQLQFELF